MITFHVGPLSSCSSNMQASHPATSFAGGRGDWDPAPGPGCERETLWRAEEKTGVDSFGWAEAKPFQELA